MGTSVGFPNGDSDGPILGEELGKLLGVELGTWHGVVGFSLRVYDG